MRDQEWTIYVCPKCGFMDPDQYSHSKPRSCPFASRGLSRDGVKLHPYSGDPDYDPNVYFEPVVVGLKIGAEATEDSRSTSGPGWPD
jgi:hypothetical protein